MEGFYYSGYYSDFLHQIVFEHMQVLGRMFSGTCCFFAGLFEGSGLWEVLGFRVELNIA